MPRSATPQEWADFVASHKCQVAKTNVTVMEHVLTETGEVIARVECVVPKRYFIFPERSALMGFICLYEGTRYEVWAKSLLLAKEQAVAHFKPPKSKLHMVSVVLAEKGGQPVTHSTTEFG